VSSLCFRIAGDV